MTTNLETINLNQRVKVKLNDRGMKIYDDFHKNLGVPTPNLIDRELIIELWDLAHVFGKSFGNGAPLVFESTELFLFN